jgi:hypothetical protein
MAGKAPLLVAALLFLLGIAGLVGTMRSTTDPAARRSDGELLVGERLAVAIGPATPTTPAEPTAEEPASPVPAVRESPAAVQRVSPPPVITPEPEAATATVEPTPTPFTGAIAAGLASDSAGATPVAGPRPPLFLGMVGRDAEEPTETPTPTTTPTATP